MNNRREVMLKIVSDTLSLPELEQRFGPASAGSHDKLDLHPSGRKRGQSIWRFENEIPESDLAAECERLVDRINLETLDGDIAAVIDIVVYFESFTISEALPSKTLRKLGEHGIGVEISCYPVST